MENLYLKHRCYFFESTGRINYDPVRNNHSEPWSAIIEIDQDIANYYRYLFNSYFNHSIIKPNWKPHISLFKGINEYNPDMQKYWKELDGKEIKFVYTKDIFWNENFVWLNTYFPEYFELREKMGLKESHKNNENWSHITIGKFKKTGYLGNFTDYNFY